MTAYKLHFQAPRSTSFKNLDASSSFCFLDLFLLLHDILTFTRIDMTGPPKHSTTDEQVKISCFPELAMANQLSQSFSTTWQIVSIGWASWLVFKGFNIFWYRNPILPLSELTTFIQFVRFHGFQVDSWTTFSSWLILHNYAVFSLALRRPAFISRDKVKTLLFISPDFS